MPQPKKLGLGVCLSMMRKIVKKYGKRNNTREQLGEFLK